MRSVLSYLPLLLFLGTAFAGCAGPQEAERADDLGRGPPPGPFLEPLAALEASRHWFMSEPPLLLAGCDGRVGEKMAFAAESYNLWEAYRSSIYHCTSNHTLRREPIMARFHGMDPDEAFADLQNGTRDRVTTMQENLSRITPANIVEAQLLAVLMIGTFNAKVTHESTTPMLYEAWKTNGENIDLKNLAQQYVAIEDWLRGIGRMIVEYPWATGQICHIVDETYEETRTIMVQVLNTAQPHVTDFDRTYITTRYGGFAKLIVPMTEWSIDREWWPAVLALRSTIEWDLEYWSNYDTGKSPQGTEALQLIEDHRSRGRSIITEHELIKLEESIDYGIDVDGEIEERDARLALSLSALRSHFPGVDCSLEGQSGSGPAPRL